MSKIVIIAGKFPTITSDIDGGSIVVNHLIGALKDKVCLDVVFLRTPNKQFNSIDGVDNVSFYPYKYRSDNKFERRIKNVGYISEYIKPLFSKYDKLIFIHCSKLFGLDSLSVDELNKIILFPMYLTPSYLKSNEIVPNEYFELEKRIISKISNIITPSEDEKNDLINIYKVSSKYINVLHRGVSDYINRTLRNNSKKECNLIYIGSIKKQKNTLDSLKLVLELHNKGVKCHLNLVGGVQDNEVYNECLNFVKSNNLSKYVTFHGTISQKELALLLEGMDFNISVSLWETFGRGIVEGLSAGLPTIIYNKIECIKNIFKYNSGIQYVKDFTKMSNEIIALYNDQELYKDESLKAINASKLFSKEEESKKLCEVIL